MFASTEDMVCFATLLNAYYQIMVDANFSILEGDPSIVPTDDMLKMGKNGMAYNSGVVEVGGVVEWWRWEG